MPEDRSIHDNHLLSYTVEATERCVTLHTAFLDSEPHEHTDIEFVDVLAYHFEGDTFGTVLFDVAEVPFAEVYTAYEDLFSRRKNYGWPVASYGSKQELMEQLQAAGIRAYLVHSSCGLDGFVLAQEMLLREAHHG